MKGYIGKIVILPAERGYSTLSQAEFYETLDKIIKENKLKIYISKKEFKKGNYITSFVLESPATLSVLYKKISNEFGDRIQYSFYRCRKKWF